MSQNFSTISREQQINYYLEQGDIYWEQYKFPETKVNYQKALELYQLCDIKDQKLEIKIRSKLSQIYHNVQNPQKAIEEVSIAVKMALDIYGENTLEVAELLNQLGKVLASTKSLENAEKCLDQALKIYKIKLENEQECLKNLDYLETLNNYAVVEETAGLIEEALSKYQQILEQRILLTGKNDEKVVSTYLQIGICYKKAHKLEESQQYLEQAAEIIKQIKENHPLHGHILMYLALVFKEKKELEKALEIALQSEDIMSKSLGSESPMMPSCYNTLADLCFQTNDLKGAKQYFEKSLEITEKLQGTKSIFCGTLHLNLGVINHRLTHYDSALTHYKQALDITQFDPENGKNNSALLNSMIGEVLIAQEQFANALTYLKEALKQNKLVVGEKHPNILQIHRLLADTYSSLNQYQEAAQHIEIALNIYDPNNKIDDSNVESLIRDLAIIYTTNKQHKKAITYFERAIKISKKLRGEHDPYHIQYQTIYHSIKSKL